MFLGKACPNEPIQKETHKKATYVCITYNGCYLWFKIRWALADETFDHVLPSKVGWVQWHFETYTVEGLGRDL